MRYLVTASRLMERRSSFVDGEVDALDVIDTLQKDGFRIEHVLDDEGNAVNPVDWLDILFRATRRNRRSADTSKG